MREGPSTEYEVIRVVPQAARVQVNGCLQGITWCDVTFGTDTGWMSAGLLVANDARNAPDARVPLAVIGAAIGVAIIASRPKVYYRPHRPRPPIVIRPNRPPILRPRPSRPEPRARGR